MTAWTATWLGVSTGDANWTNAANWDCNVAPVFPVPDGSNFTVNFNDPAPHYVGTVVIPADPGSSVSEDGVDYPYIAVAVLNLNGPLDGGGYEFYGGELVLWNSTGGRRKST